MKNKLLHKIKKLSLTLKKHDDLYFKKSLPIISDVLYDKLRLKLENLENIYLKKNININIGDDRLKFFTKKKHINLMLSINNAFNINDVLKFNKNISKKLNNQVISYTVEPKIDGMAINILYKNGFLHHATTRGNGVEGDDITNNIKYINNLPFFLQNYSKLKDPKIIEVRGEIYIDNKDFENINNESLKLKNIIYKTSRNATSGIIKSKNIDSKKISKLKICFFGLGYSDKNIFLNQVEIYENLKKWGLPILTDFYYAKDIEECIVFIKKLKEKKENLSFNIDGIVLKVNDIEKQKSLGNSLRYPKWAIAYKFSSQKHTTVIKNININIGKKGILTPVAILDPVNIDGTIIGKSTLHNYEFIKQKDIRIGDIVVLEKSGTVIPSILDVIKEKRSNNLIKYLFPKNCPSCGKEIYQSKNNTQYICINKFECREQITNNIIHFASKECLNIKNFGYYTVSKLVNKKLCYDITDIYNLKLTDLLSIDNINLIIAKKILENIQKTLINSIKLDKLIYSLNIPNVGKTTASKLSNHFNKLEDFINDKMLIEKLENIKFSTSTKNEIKKYFLCNKNIIIIKKLIKIGLN